jgi:hypothetical protein
VQQTEGVSINLREKEITAGQEVHGKITISYAGRFDTVVINSQIEYSNAIFNFKSLNGKSINYPYARLSIFNSELEDKQNLVFTAVTSFVPPDGSFDAKFRVAIVQEHKEVASDVGYIKILARQ